MDFRRLRRSCLLREGAGFLALPLVYGALMGAGVLSYAPSLAFLTMGLVMMLVLQQRSGAMTAGVAPKRKGRGGPSFPAAALDAADRSILRQIVLAAGTDLASYVVLIVAIDLHLRAVAALTDPGLVLYAGAGVSLAIAIAGRQGARRAAWASFRAEFPQVWAAADGLNGGRSARATAAYLAWRESATVED